MTTPLRLFKGHASGRNGLGGKSRRKQLLGLAHPPGDLMQKLGGSTSAISALTASHAQARHAFKRPQAVETLADCFAQLSHIDFFAAADDGGVSKFLHRYRCSLEYVPQGLLKQKCPR